MASSNERLSSMHHLAATSASWMSSYHSFEGNHMPGPHDAAEMEMKEEMLIDAARAFVKAHEGVETIIWNGARESDAEIKNRSK